MLKKFKNYSKRPKVLAVGSVVFALVLLLFALSPDGLRSSVSYDGPDTFSETTVDVAIAPPPARSRFSDAGLIADFLSRAEVKEFPFERGDSVAKHLSAIGVGKAEIHDITQTLKPVIKMSEIKSGSDRMQVKYRTGADGSAEVLSLDIIRSPIYRVRARRQNEGFEIQEIRADVSTSLSRATGTIDKGMSFIEAATAAGVPHGIIVRVHDIFSFDVDFVRDIHPNDSFAIMFESIYSEDGTFLGAGELLYAEIYLNSRRKGLALYRYETENGTVGYFDETGSSATKSLKKTPLNNARISSRYGMRRHPVLGFSREHKGVDFAAPHGTPIPAGGSGTVVAKGFDRYGYGNYVKIRHNGTYSTLYAHLSSFQRGIGVGTHVNQGQIIGFVGSTGISTGPHLHYEIHRNNAAVNPLAVNLPPSIALPKNERGRFADAVERLNSQFAGLDKAYPAAMAQR